MAVHLSGRAGWALSLTGLAVAGLFASWQAGQLQPVDGCDQSAVVWTYHVGPTADGRTQVLGVRFDDVPSSCAATPVEVQFTSGGRVVDSRRTTLGQGEVLAAVPADGATWVQLG